MKKSRCTDNQILSILKQAEADPHRADTVPRTRHESCHLLPMAIPPRRHGRLTQWPVSRRSKTRTGG